MAPLQMIFLYFSFVQIYARVARVMKKTTRSPEAALLQSGFIPLYFSMSK